MVITIILFQAGKWACHNQGHFLKFFVVFCPWSIVYCKIFLWEPAWAFCFSAGVNCPWCSHLFRSLIIICDPLPQNAPYKCKSPEYFLRYRPMNIPQINRKQRNFQQKYWFYMSETLSNYDKGYIILKLRVSAFVTWTNLKNDFKHLRLVLSEWVTYCLLVTQKEYDSNCSCTKLLFMRPKKIECMAHALCRCCIFSACFGMPKS